MASSWIEYLCIEPQNGSRIVLSSRGYEVLVPVRDVEEENEDGDTDYNVPKTIDGKEVYLRRTSRSH